MAPHQLEQEVIGEDKRQEDNDCGERCCNNGTPHLFRSPADRFVGCEPGSRQPVDIFQYHNAVIQQHTYGQRHSYERQAID